MLPNTRNIAWFEWAPIKPTSFSQEHTYENLRLAAFTTDTPLAPFTFERRSLRANDVMMEILYGGICHSDLHTARNDWDLSYYPIVPGHEIVGRVTEVGTGVSMHKVGEHVAARRTLCQVDPPLDPLPLEQREEALGYRVVATVAAPAHAADDAMRFQERLSLGTASWLPW